jgi:GNAT superfamily N-acetyltransferase
MFDLVVDEPFRNRGLGKMLFGLAGDFLRQKNDEGYAVSRIFGYSITEKGFRVLQSYGGRKFWTRDGVTFFEVNKEAFMGLKQ